MSIQSEILSGDIVKLEPLEETHREPLRLAADDERIWQHTLMVARGAGFDEWFNQILTKKNNGQQIPFVVRLQSTQAPIGSTSYFHIDEFHRRLEIGGTWYTPECWDTKVNPACKFLLLQNAFENHQANRVELCTDLQNTRSQSAIAKLGAVREGVLRSHMITQGGRLRDSVLFSITATEWPQVKENLLKRLA